MWCKTILYENFRNIEKSRLCFSPGMNLLYGKNAMGKTSALEGISLLACGRSHRSTREYEFLREGCESATLTMQFQDSRREQEIRLAYLRRSEGTLRKSLRLNGNYSKKMSEVIGRFRAVLFCPEHMSLVRDGPGVRRNFLDGAISQGDSEYLTALQIYNRAMLQRNRLLDRYFEEKDNREWREVMEAWSEQMAICAEKICEKRVLYLAKLEKEAAAILRDMAEGEKLTLLYRRPLKIDDYRRQFANNLVREATLGYTLYGIQRDDVEIRIGNRPAREFSSQGQCRSVAIAIKLAEGSLIRQEIGEEPVYLLDDILSELDEGRRNYLLSGFVQDSKKQVIITACDMTERELLKIVPQEGKCFYVENGHFTAGHTTGGKQDILS